MHKFTLLLIVAVATWQLSVVDGHQPGQIYYKPFNLPGKSDDSNEEIDDLKHLSDKEKRKLLKELASMESNPLSLIKSLTNVEYFRVDEDDGEDGQVCQGVPRRTQSGDPFNEACGRADEEDEMCMCVKLPEEILDKMKKMRALRQSLNKKDLRVIFKSLKKSQKPFELNSRNGFAKVCGKCVDPCSLKFTPRVDAEALPPPPLPPLPFLLGNAPRSFGSGSNRRPAGGRDSDEDEDDEEVPKFVESLIKTALTILKKEEEEH